MLARGTAKRSRQEIEDTIDRLRAKVSSRVPRRAPAPPRETVRDHLPDTLRLIAEMLREPAFPPAEFDKLAARGNRPRLEASRTDPEAIARRAVRRYGNPYPRGDPRYAPTVDEEIAFIRKTTVDDLKRFHGRFVGGNGEIAVVGDFDADAVRRVLAESFGVVAEGGALHARSQSPW